MKKIKVLLLTSILITTFAFSGCGKDDETSDSTAVSVTPTPTASPSVTPTASITPTPTTGSSSEIVAPSTELTGIVVSATMNDLVLRTSDNKEYNCSTLNATKNLAHGVTIGATMTVTLDSTQSQGGYFKAVKLADGAGLSGSTTGTDSSTQNQNGSSDSNAAQNGSSSLGSSTDSSYDSGSSYDSDSDSGYNYDSDSDSGYDSDSDSGYDSSYYGEDFDYN